MDWQALPFVWAETQPAPASAQLDGAVCLAAGSPASLCRPRKPFPIFHPLFALLARSPSCWLSRCSFRARSRVLKQIFDLPGHVRIVQDATRRVWLAGRLIAIVIGFTVLGWTASQALVFMRDDGRRA